MSNRNKTQSYSASRHSKLTRFMAAFTASLFLVSSQLALPAQANNLARGDMSRQEWRQFRLENRQALRGGAPTTLPHIQPISVPVTQAEPLNPAPILHSDNAFTITAAPGVVNTTGGNVTVGSNAAVAETGPFNASTSFVNSGTVTTSAINLGANLRAAGGRNRANRNTNARLNPPSRAAKQAARAENRINRIADRNENRAAALSRFVIQENAGSIVRLDNGANLDLTTSQANITLGDKLFAKGGFVTIEVGGEKKNVYAGSKVTAAEYVAVKQVLSGNQQTLTVNGSGVATGGTVDLSQVSATKNTMKADSLTVAEGVTAIGDLDRHSSFRLSGDLNNYGSVYAVNSGNAKRGADIAAENINNAAGALISSNAGSQFGNQQSAIDLSVRANQNLNNAGTIESSGDLTLSAGNSINNSGSASAAGNVNLSSSNIVNSGVVSAAAGNITVDTPAAAALNVNNNGGTLQALEGAINVRRADYNGTFDSNLYGGDLLSKEVNLQSGLGLTTVDVNELTGVVNGTGTAAHVSANTDNLKIGTTCLTGDPVYKNAAGNITIDGDIIVGETLAILASGNITSTVNCDLIQAQAGGVGQNIVIAAGFQLGGGGGGGTDNTTPIPPATETTSNLTVFNGGVAQGGNIDFTNSVNLVIDASGSAGNAGGNVSLYARGDNTNTLGHVLLGTDSTINTFSTSGSTNGDITVYAGRDAGVTGIQLGSLIADGGGATTGGNIIVRNAQPSAGGGVTFDTDGTIIAGGFTAAATLSNPGVVIGGGQTNLIAAGNNIIVNAGSGGANVDLTNTGFIESSAGDITISALNAGAVSVTVSDITTQGGDVSLTAGGNVSITAPNGISTSPLSGGAGGNVLLRADTNSNNTGLVNAAGVNITTSGITLGAAGSVTVDVNLGVGAGQTVTVGDLTTLGAGADGGDISLRAGDDLTVGTILSNAGGDLNVQTSANNGDINLGGDVTAGTVTASVNGTGVINTPVTGIIFTTDGYNVTGTVNALGLPVTIQNLTAGTTIGVAGGGGTLNISTTELSSIIADSLTIGSANSGNIAVGGNIDVSGAGPNGAYNLTFLGGGTFTTGLFDINLGARNLVVDVAGNLTTDSVTATTGNVTLDSGAAINTGLVTGSIIDMDAVGNINLRGNLTAIDQIILNAAGIVVPVLNVALSTSADNSLIDITTSNAAVPLIIGTAVQQLTLAAPGADSTIDLEIAGNINVTSTGGFTTDNIIMETTGAGSDIIFNGNVTGNDSFNITSNDQIQVGATVTGNSGITGLAGGNIFGSGTFVSTFLDLTSTGGSIGTSTSARLNGQTTGTVNLNAANGDVFYEDTGSLNLGDSTAAAVGGTMDITTTGAGTFLFLDDSTYGGATQVYRSINGEMQTGDNTQFDAANSVSLRSFERLFNEDIGGVATFNTPQANFTSDNSDINFGPTDRFVIVANSISANAPLGDVWIQANGDITIGGPSSLAGEDFDILTTAGGDITTTSTITSDNLILEAADSIVINSSVTGTSTATLVATNSITGTGQVNGALVDLSTTNGNIGVDATDRLNVDADNLTVDAGQDAFIHDVDSVTLLDASANGLLNVRAQGTLSTTGGTTVSGSFVRLQSVTDDVLLNTDVTTPGSSVTLQAASEIIQSAGTINALALIILGGNTTITQTTNGGFGQFIQVSNPTTDSANITTQETGTVFLGASTGDDLTFNAAQATNVTINGAITADGTLDITTSYLNNTMALTGDIINVQSPNGDLTIDGGNPTAGSFTSTNGTNLTATSGDLIFIDNTNFFGVANLFSNPNPPFGSIIISNASTVTGFDEVNLNTCSLILQGTGIITGNPLNFNCPTGAGTIANTSGDVDLTALGPVINFNGSELAIIASGNIITTGALTIDLSDFGSGNDGGDLTMIAGYNWTPATGTQQNFTPIVFTLTGPSAGGSINLGSTTILTGGDNAGGDVTAIAQNGTVTLGSINANSNSALGGVINIVGENGVTVNDDIQTNGNGAVIVAVSTPQVTGTLRVGNGIIITGAIADSGVNSSGDMTLDGINAPTVNLIGAAGAIDSIIQGGDALIADTLNIAGGDGLVFIQNGQVDVLNSNANGSVQIFNSVDIDVDTVTGVTQLLTVVGDQDVNFITPFTIFNLDVLAGEGGTGDVNFNAAITTTISITANIFNSGDINVNGALASGAVGLFTQSGDINTSDTIVATDNGVTDPSVFLEASNVVSVGDDITADSTLTIVGNGNIDFSANSILTAVNGVFLNSVNTITGTAGIAVQIDGGDTVQVDNDIAISSADIDISASNLNGTVNVQGIDTSGLGGAFVLAGAGDPGQAGGSVTITSDTTIDTGFIRSYGGGGGGAFAGNGGDGGAGGTVTLTSNNGGAITVVGDINTSGGGGGAAAIGTGGLGGAGGAIQVSTTGVVTVSGPILAAGGGDGNTNALNVGGGGGSFGGGGGGTGGTGGFGYAVSEYLGTLFGPDGMAFDTTGFVSILTSGDDVSTGVNFGFPFSLFGGAPNSSGTVSSNGNVYVGSGSTVFTPFGFPSNSGLQQIALFFNDINLNNGGTVSNLSTSSQYVVDYDNVEFFSGTGFFNGQVGLMNTGNVLGLPVGTVVLSYGLTQDAGSNSGNTVTVGLNFGDGIQFSTLSGLGIGNANGTMTRTDVQTTLAGRTFAFSPTNNNTGGGGGGGFAGGASSNPTGAGGGGGGFDGGGVAGPGGADGTSGLGGGGGGGLFGQGGLGSGGDGNDVGFGGAAGAVNISGGGVTVSGTVANTFAGAGFSGSAFANQSVYGSSVTINSTAGATIAGDVTGTTGAVAVNTVDALDVQGNVTSVLNNVVLDSSASTVNVTGDVAALGSVTVDADGALTAGATVKSFGSSIDLSSATATVNVTGDVDALGSVTAIADGALTLGGDVISSLTFVNLSSTTSTVDVTGNISGDGAVTVNADGALTVGGIVQSVTSTVDLLSATGLVSAGSSISAAGDINILSQPSFTANGDIVATFNVNIDTNVLNNTFLISGDSVSITSLAGSSLTIDGSAGPGGTLTATAGSVNLGVGTVGDVTFIGEQTFNGTTNIDPSMNQSVIVSNGAVVTGSDTVNLNTCSLILQGNGVITGNPLVFNCPNGAGTIANSSGDVDLGLFGPLVFNGQSLAIIASEDVLANGQTAITLFGGALTDGGDLTVIAGFDFTPSTGGMQTTLPNPIVYTVGAPNAAGGNIDLSGLSVTTFANLGGNGGAVTLIANGDGATTGNITINAINSSSNAGFAGDVLIIGEGDISTGTIGSNGFLGGGNITIANAQPTTTGTVLLANGELTGGGAFLAGAPSSGSITTGALDAGASSIAINGGLTATDTITVANAVADTLNVTTGLGSAVVNNSSVNTLNVSSNGAVTLSNETGALALGSITGINGDLTVVSTGAITTTSTFTIDDLSLTGSSVAISNDVTVDQLTLTGNSVDVSAVVTANGTADVDATNGDLTLAATGSLIGTGDKNLSAAGTGIVNVLGTLAGPTVNLDSADGDVSVAGTVTGGDLNFTTSGLGSISVLATANLTGTTFTFTANGAGNVTNFGTLTATTVNLTTNGTGDVAVFAAVNATDVTLTASGGGDVLQDMNGVISATTLTVDLTGGGLGILDNATNNVVNLNGAGGGQIFFDNGANALNLGTFGATQQVVASTSSSITTTADITTTGDIDLLTPVLNNTFVISAANITVESQTGLTIDGSAASGGTLTATGSVTINGLGGDVTFIGEQTFNGLTNITPGGPGFGVVISDNAVVTGNNDVFLNTCLLLLQGTGSITANLLHLNCPDGAGTIANSSGDVDLNGLNLTFDGQSLAIIASGNVINTGAPANIDLSSTTGDGGDLLIVAGFDFSPATVGPQDNFTDIVYTFSGMTSTTGGNISLAGTNITTSGAVNGNGGSITLVAAAGTPNAGSIDIGNLVADGAAGAGNGGDILVIAEGGFATGTISNTGLFAGSTTLAAATPTIVNGPVMVGDGKLLQGEFTFGGATSSGTIANMVGDVDLGNLDLTIVGLNLAIIASGDILATGTTTSIDLSNGSGAGGNLLMVAGFDFSPGTGNVQVNFDDSTLFTFGAPSATGGDIALGSGFTITTNGNGGDAGNITLVAKAGTPNTGSINVGDLNLVGTGGGNGGDLLVIAEGGFTVGNFDTSGAVAGSQTLAAATPLITGGNITVLNGTQGGPGAFTFAGPTGSGTIANSTGDVNLSGAIGFTGLSLAILAANDVIAAPGTVIDVSDSIGDGGDVTVIAGFNFTPATAGQITDIINVYTIGAANPNGGNVDMINATINTSGLNSAGNVLVVAKGGTSSSGQITLGDIDASSAGAAGTVTIIGENGVTVSDIDATGATGGDVSLLVAVPTVSGGPVTVQNGNLLSGTFVAGGLTNGFVGIGSVDAGNNITVSANTPTGITIGNLSADNDINVVNTGSVTIAANLLSDLGSINVTANDVAGAATLLTIADGVNITANTQINIVNSGTDRRLDQFILGVGSSLATTAKSAGVGVGDINLRIGATINTPNRSNRLPQRSFTVDATGGTLNLFGGRPRGVTPVNTLTLLGADINLTNSLRGRALLFNGGVTLTADPPVAVGTPRYINGRLVGDSENVSRSGQAVAINALEELTSALDANLISGNAFDHAQTSNLLSTTVIGTDVLPTVGTSLTAGTVGTGNTTSKTETLVGAVSQAFQGEDNSYMVSSSGPATQAEASICSDADLGTAGNTAHIAHNDRVVLKKGNVLFVPFRNTVVETPQGNVVIEAKSIALVSVSNDKLAVYDLEDSHKGAVSVEAHGQKVTLAPGSHLTIAKSGEFAQVNAIEAIPHRNVATKVIKNGAKLHTSEFSVVAAMATVKPLQAVMNSKHPQAKKVADRMMKTTAVLLTLGGKGEFQHFFKPALTAMK